MRTKILGLLAVGLLAGTVATNATPVQVGLGAFGPGATTYSFGSTGAPSIAGITFSGSLAQQQAPSSWGAESAPPFNTFSFYSSTIRFATPVQQVGFYFGGNTPNTVPLDLGLGAVTTGSFILQTTGTNLNMPPDGINNWIFFGFYDPAGIDSLTFNAELNNGWYLGIGELTVGGVSVPEPGTLTLLGLGLAGLGLSRRRKAA